MCEIKSMSDFNALFEEPFRPRKILYSLTFLDDILKSSSKQVAIDFEEEESHYKSLPPFPCGEIGCRSTFSTVRDYEVHCRSVHRLVCSECKKSFPTYNMLDVHIQEKHDSYHQVAIARNKAKFDCFVEGCGRSYSSGEERDLHVVSDHNYPSNFKFQPLKSTASKTEAMEVSTEDETPVATIPGKSRGQVPRNVCFGRGLPRTFQRAPRKKPSKEISMKELGDAL